MVNDGVVPPKVQTTLHVLGKTEFTIAIFPEVAAPAVGVKAG